MTSALLKRRANTTRRRVSHCSLQPPGRARRLESATMDARGARGAGRPGLHLPARRPRRPQATTQNTPTLSQRAKPAWAPSRGLEARPTNSNVKLHKRLHTHSHHLVATRTEGGNRRPCGGFAADEGIGSGPDARSDALAWASRTTYCSTPSRELTRVRARVKFIKLWHPKPRRADRVVVDSSMSLSIEEVCRVTAGPGFPDEVEPTRRNRVVGIQVSHWWARLGTGATRRVLLRAGRQGVARAGTRAGAAGERDRNRAHAHGAR